MEWRTLRPREPEPVVMEIDFESLPEPMTAGQVTGYRWWMKQYGVQLP